MGSLRYPTAVQWLMDDAGAPTSVVLCGAACRALCDPPKQGHPPIPQHCPCHNPARAHFHHHGSTSGPFAPKPLPPQSTPRAAPHTAV